MEALRILRALEAARDRLDFRQRKAALRLCLPSDQAEMSAQLDAIGVIDQKLRRAIRVVTVVTEGRGCPSQYSAYLQEALKTLASADEETP